MKANFWCNTVAALATSILFLSPAAPCAYAAAAGGASQVAPATVYGKLLSNVEKEVVSAAEAMPADKYDFAPSTGEFKGVRTFGQQVKHIAEANYGLLSGFGIKPDVEPKSIDGLTSKEDIVKALRGSFAFAQKAFDTITPGNAFASLDAHQSTRAGSAAMALIHTNDHYGQMVEYLRMNGIVPPASRK